MQPVLVTEERALLTGEMQAAQEIQRALVPASIDTLPGLEIAVAFHPMRDVGGDFYHCRILPGDRQRILLGDVSGKGAAAAMTAAVLLGAAQRRENETPAALLRHLNGVLKDMRLGGFATCICAELTANGTLTIANAGHLAPYRNGSEMSISNGMPLGIAAETSYDEVRFTVTPGDCLTFLSDGVVEARNVKGELLGFECMAPLSTKPAAEIAEAAQRWGQEDDITVLTVARVPKLETIPA
jgi:serine phosphatase RsbU (regulator of sigma subunit)